jgi:hypothetical protein
MTKFITLNMIAGRESSHDESGEDDGLAAVTVSEVTKETDVAVDQIRNYYPRRGDRGVGTRIMFRNGSALPVKETLAEVRALIQAVLR